MAKEYDNIIVQHEIRLGRITPTDSWDKNVLPGISDTDIFNLDDFPLDILPSGGISGKISESEMAIIYIRMDNYPKTTSDMVTFIWYREVTPGNWVSFATLNGTDSHEEPYWEYWYSWDYSFVGHFSWEINQPGNYAVEIKTGFGDAWYNFTVIGAKTPPKKAMPGNDIGKPPTENEICFPDTNVDTEFGQYTTSICPRGWYQITFPEGTKGGFYRTLDEARTGILADIATRKTPKYIPPSLSSDKNCNEGNKYEQEWYTLGILPCADGYRHTLNPDEGGYLTCLCEKNYGTTTEKIKEISKDVGKDLGFQPIFDVLKILPQILIVLVIVQIIGAFKK